MMIQSQADIVSKINQTHAHIVQAMSNDVDYDTAELSEARQDFVKLIAAHAGDDALAEAQAEITNRESILAITKARFQGALNDQAAGNAKARADAGNAHNEAADVAIAEWAAMVDEMMSYGEKIVCIGEKAAAMSKPIDENRRYAHHYGVKPTMHWPTKPDIGPAIAALRQVAASTSFWNPTY